MWTRTKENEENTVSPSHQEGNINEEIKIIKRNQTNSRVQKQIKNKKS
jgi:hypothetical protein